MMFGVLHPHHVCEEFPKQQSQWLEHNTNELIYQLVRVTRIHTAVSNSLGLALVRKVHQESAMVALNN